MKTLIFDTSSIISLVTNDLLHTLAELKKNFIGEFYIPNSVKVELIDKPLSSKMFKLEAIMLSKAINDGLFVIHSPLDVEDLLLHVNNIFSVKGKAIHILDRAEVEAFALVLRLQADAYVVDERTIRLLIEDPFLLKSILERKLHTRVDMNKKYVKEFQHIARGVKVMRSVELIVVAYEKGLLNQFITTNNTNLDLLDGLLWGLKLRGCAISSNDINKIIKLESKG